MVAMTLRGATNSSSKAYRAARTLRQARAVALVALERHEPRALPESV
jgi:hypothetical protein